MEKMVNHQREYERANIPPDIVSNAREGDAAAQLVMGKFYFETASIENNRRIAFEWITLSAKQGNMEAQFRLADLYILGQGTSKCFSDAYQWYTKAAIQGYKKALIRLHNLYHDDIKMHCRGQIDANKPQHLAKPGRLQRFETVLNCTIGYYTGQFKHYQSSKQGDCGVQLNLAFLYQHGYGVKKCIKWAFEYYTKAAEQGSTDAQYNLGYLFQKHTDIKFNYRQAFKWFTQSAQGGNIAAQRSLAYFYLKGLATDIDYDIALFWYNKAAEAGDSGAQVILGKLYRKGDCVKQDLLMAAKWYSLAARQGNIVAQNCLSQLHQRGILNNIQLEEDILEYVTEDSMNSRLVTKLSIDVSKQSDSPNFKQLNELARCALIGDGRAMYEIGLKYLNGDDDFTQEQDVGAKWIKNAANAKYKLAQSMMADLYNKGDSIEQDYFKATIWYKTLAKKKDSTAQCNVGIMYSKGHGVRKDPLEASKWFTWAVDQGNSDAQHNLGMLKLYGNGLRQDKKAALEWLLKSIYQKNIQTCYIVGIFYLNDKYVEEQSAEIGLKLLEFAAKNGSIKAQVELGRYYSDTKTEYHDLSKSILYYTMAVDSGDMNASHTLAMIYLNENDTPKDYINLYSLFKQSEEKAQDLFKTLVSASSSINDYSEVINMFIEVNNRGVDDLHYNIGNLYENGVRKWKNYIFDTDYASANEWYQAASNKGDSRADYRLGVMHECGKYFKRDTDTAMIYYNKASSNGNADASYRLAYMYVNGYGVAQDLLKAFHLFTMASAMGHENASKELKVERVYEKAELNRSSSPVNKKTRIRMLEKATEEGYIRLQYQLGIMYEKNKDYQKSFKWFSLAANIGITDAYYRVGVFYEEGKGVDQGCVMAATMYQKAAEKEHEDACYRLGQLYQYGNGIELDYLKAYHFYKKAADLGHVEAYKILNITLKPRTMSNVDAEKNLIEPPSQEYQDSLLMCKCVAEHGDTEVQFRVGFAYEHNDSKPNYDEAYKWYMMAVKSSHKEAMYHLGLLYEKGLGVSQDYQKANELYEWANQQSSEDALYRLGTLYHHGKGVEADSEKAIKYYKRAAEQGNPQYQYELGRLYEDGELAQKNLLEALKWYTKAYLQGYNDAKPKLYDTYDHEPYEDFFFKKLLQKLLVASQGYFRLKDFYYSFDYCDINSRIGALYFFGQGTDKDLGEGWDYLSMKYSKHSGRENTDFLFIESNSLGSNQKSAIVNAIEEDDKLFNKMGEKQLYRLGMHFFEGVLKKRNSYTTLEYYDQDHSSQHVIIDKNYTKAFNCLKKAADKDYPPAIHQLGIMYHCGYGTEQDIGQGEEYFNEVVNDDPEYMKSIAMLYHTHDGMQNFTKAFQWYKRYEEWLDEDSKGSGHKVANDVVQAGLGLLYEYGDGVKQDYQKAIEYYQNLVNNNTRLGFHRMGLMYYYGKGVSVNYKKAMSLFEKAIYGKSTINKKVPFVYLETHLHDDDAQDTLVFCTVTYWKLKGEPFYYLGMMHKNGHGVRPDEEKAQGYFSEALYHRCKRAKHEIRE